MIPTLYKKIISIFALLCFVSTFAGAQIKAGSSVEISIKGVPENESSKITGIYPLSDSGFINMPFIGNIKASGLEPHQLASVIQDAYRSAQIYNNPTIQVISTREGSSVLEETVFVGGQIRKPGPVSYQSGLTIYQAVQAAGGATEFGSLKRVKLHRGGRLVTLDLTDSEVMRYLLRPSDTIEVPDKNLLGR